MSDSIELKKFWRLRKDKLSDIIIETTLLCLNSIWCFTNKNLNKKSKTKISS